MPACEPWGATRTQSIAPLITAASARHHFLIGRRVAKGHSRHPMVASNDSRSTKTTASLLHPFSPKLVFGKGIVNDTQTLVHEFRVHGIHGMRVVESHHHAPFNPTHRGDIA